MENNWKKSEAIDEVSIQKKGATNTSRKMGIAMGVVGAVLVVAGAAPLFMSSDNLSGDITADTSATEAPDPLVQLLMGGNEPTPAAVSPQAKAGTLAQTTTEKSSNETERSPSPSPTKIAQTPIPTGTKAAPKTSPVATTSNANASELEKILAEEGEIKVTNNNTGKTDTEGDDFGEKTQLTDDTMHSSGTTASSVKSQPTPKQTVQTGMSSALLFGMLFLIAGGYMVRRRSA